MRSGQFLVVDGGVVAVADRNFRLGAGTLGDLPGDRDDVAVHLIADRFVVGPDRARHLHRLRHDVGAGAPVDGADRDHGR